MSEYQHTPIPNVMDFILKNAVMNGSLKNGQNDIFAIVTYLDLLNSGCYHQ